MASSRTERLIQLITGGSNSLIRLTADEQIAKLVQEQPQQWQRIIKQLQVHLRSSSWATRVAVADTLRMIAQQIQIRLDHDYPPPATQTIKEEEKELFTKQEPDEGKTAMDLSMSDDTLFASGESPSSTSTSASLSLASIPLLSLRSFSTKQVIARGTLMLASSGREYIEFAESLARLPLNERAALQRRELLKRLGCEDGRYEAFAGERINTLIQEEDLNGDMNGANPTSNSSSRSTAPTAATSSIASTSTDPKKHRRDAKKSEGKRPRPHSPHNDDVSPPEEPTRKRLKSKAKPASSSSSSSMSAVDELFVESVDLNAESSNPFLRPDGHHVLTSFLSQMMWQLLDATSWEVRHGAALALRAVLLHLTKATGKNFLAQTSPTERIANHRAHQTFLSDTCARILCVLLLDRFGDYSGEFTSYPVRETAAQILSLLAVELEDTELILLVKNLLEMSDQSDSQLRYGAFIGLKYILNVRFVSNSFVSSSSSALNVQLLNLVLDDLMDGLDDDEDDVRGMVAESLLAIVNYTFASPQTSSLISSSQLTRLVDSLWSALKRCDDLTSSIVQLLELIRTIYDYVATSHTTTTNSVTTIFREINASRLPLSTRIQQLLPFIHHAFISCKVNAWRTILTLIKLSFIQTNQQNELPTLTTLIRYAYQSFITESDEAVHESCFQLWELFTNSDHFFTSSNQFLQLFESIITPCMDLLCTPLFQPIPSRLFLTNVNDFQSSTPSNLVSSLEMKLRLSRALGMMYQRLSTVSDPNLAKRILPHFQLLETHLSSAHDLFVQMSCFVLCEWWSRATINKGSTSGMITSINWRRTLQPLIDPQQTTRTRSPNTKSILAQTFVQFCAVTSLSSECRQPLLLCIPPLLLTLEIEKNFELLQERCAQYLAQLLFLLKSTTNLSNGVKQEPTVHMSPTKSQNETDQTANEVIQQVMDLLCCTLPTPTPVANSTNIKPERAVKEENEASATNDELLAMLQDDNGDDNEHTEMKDATHLVSPPGLSSNSSSTRRVIDPNLAPTAERGARLFLRSLCRQCDSHQQHVFDVYPSIWNVHILPGLSTALTSAVAHTEETQYSVIRSLQILHFLLPSASCTTYPQLLTLLPSIQQCLFLPTTPNSRLGDSLTTLTIQVLVQYVQFMTAPTMEAFIRDLLPILSSTSPISNNVGIGGVKIAVLNLLQSLFNDLTMPLLPYLPFFVLPMLGCMSDVSSPGSGGVSHAIRIISSRIFGHLMSLIPLEMDIQPPKDMSLKLQHERFERRQLLRQLTDGSQVSELRIPPGLLQSDIILRPYQCEGIKWLNFLHQFHLHGILCDEMGVGKTLQCIVMVAMNLLARREKFRAELQKVNQTTTATPPSSTLPFLPLPSLILCPSTLIHHWEYEFRKFINPQVCQLELLVYHGNTKQKAQIRQQFLQMVKSSTSSASSSTSSASLCDPILIMSYDSIRKDAHYLSHIAFHHLILDEGHLIQNSTSQLAHSIKSLQSISRLILSGTPLSNHVLELWSLFDFLLPGYLGTEKEFRTKYALPIQKARKIELEKVISSSKRRKQEHELNEKSLVHQAITSAGNIALEQLHHRVLPFLLRRLKSDVLKDLPPKIIQDIRVELSEVQQELYSLIEGKEEELEHEFTRSTLITSEPSTNATAASSSTAPSSNQMHTFQALHYLRKLCSHPALVLTQQHPLFQTIQAKFFSTKSKESIYALKHAPKLLALKELLIECGIGTSDEPEDNSDEEAANSLKLKKSKSKSSSIAAEVEDESLDDLGLEATTAPPRHRVLIFAQLKSTLDRVEQDLFNSHPKQAVHPDGRSGFPVGRISFLRLDGSTPPSQRFSIAQQFNQDTSIDCLLLTTSVGGLGLNLVGADTIIFLEHAYNPTVDIQAMDRCHRLGQRASVVQIYRLICKDTLEERIMSLQRLKLFMTQTIVNHENASMNSMDTSQVLERFEVNSSTPPAASTTAASTSLAGVDTNNPLPSHPSIPSSSFSTMTDVNITDEDEAVDSLATFLSSYPAAATAKLSHN